MCPWFVKKVELLGPSVDSAWVRVDLVVDPIVKQFLGEHAVEPVFDLVVFPIGQMLCDQGPLIPKLFLQLKYLEVFFNCPFVLVDLGI